MGRRTEEGETVVASNRKARHDYELLERFEAGIKLTGDEVKSLRAGRASLVDAFARPRDGELWLEGMHVPPYEQGDTKAHLPLRPRKLLLHRREIDAMARDVAEKGLSVVPAPCLLHARHREGRTGASPREAPLREAAVDREARGPARDGTRSRPPPLGLQPGRTPTVYFSGQPNMGVYWLRFGRRTVWEKRAVIPDVT